MREDKAQRSAVAIHPIDLGVFSAEWMDQLIEKIQPRLTDVRVTTVRIGNDAQRGVYVIEIGQGGTAHQALDHRYYRRRNVTVAPMQDYEVRDVMGRRTLPAVTTTVKLFIKASGQEGWLWWEVANTSSVMARHVATLIQVPWMIAGTHAEFKEGASEVDEAGFVYTKLSAINRSGVPLFPGGSLSRKFDFEFHGATLSGNVKPFPHLTFRTFADNMAPVQQTLDPDSILTRVRGLT